MVGIISVVIGGHFGGRDHFDGGDHFGGGTSLRSKRFQSSYCAKVRAGAKKKVEGGGGGEKRKRLPANPTILKNAP